MDVKVGQTYQTSSGVKTITAPGNDANMWHCGGTSTINVPFYIESGAWKLISSVGDRSMTPRQKLAEKIISDLQDHAYVFGGYLRDQLAGEEFVDVDLFFPAHDNQYSNLPIWRLASFLRSKGLNVMKIKSGKPAYASDGSGIRRNTYDITDPITGVTIQIDAVTSDSTSDHPFSDLDADVNSLYYDKILHMVRPHWVTPYSILDIKKHITEKIFEMPDSAVVPGHRLNKLLNKGYVPVNMKSPDKQESLHKLAYNRSTTINTETQVNPRKEIKIMGFFEQAKAEMSEAAWREGAELMTKAAKEGILASMKDTGADDGFLANFSKMLDTEAGTAFVNEFLGHSLPYAPFGIGEDPRAIKIAHEFRVAGYHKGMQIFFAMMMRNFLPGIRAALDKLPAVTAADMAELDAASKAKVRVESEPDTLIQAQIEAQAVLEQSTSSSRVMHRT